MKKYQASEKKHKGQKKQIIKKKFAVEILFFVFEYENKNEKKKERNTKLVQSVDEDRDELLSSDRYLHRKKKTHANR